MTQEAGQSNAIRKTLLASTLTLIGAASMTQSAAAQAQVIPPATTGVMVILTAKPTVTREQVMAVMPEEVRQTVQLYLGGKIRDWYSRADGRGAIFLINAKTVSEAQALMEDLPLSRQNLMDHDYIPVGPLLPLRLLMAGP